MFNVVVTRKNADRTLNNFLLSEFFCLKSSLGSLRHSKSGFPDHESVRSVKVFYQSCVIFKFMKKHVLPLLWDTKN